MARAVRGACPVTRISNFPLRVRASVRKVEVSNERGLKRTQTGTTFEARMPFTETGRKLANTGCLSIPGDQRMMLPAYPGLFIGTARPGRRMASGYWM